MKYKHLQRRLLYRSKLFSTETIEHGAKGTRVSLLAVEYSSEKVERNERTFKTLLT